MFFTQLFESIFSLEMNSFKVIFRKIISQNIKARIKNLQLAVTPENISFKFNDLNLVIFS